VPGTARTFDGVEYAPGRDYVVLAEGLSLTGYGTDRPGSARGWRQRLAPGDVITCLGYGPGWGSDPGYGINWTSEQARTEGAYAVDVWPSVGGLFAYRPPPGTVRPVEVPASGAFRDRATRTAEALGLDDGADPLDTYLEQKGER
jgi:hypothetical protein